MYVLGSNGLDRKKKKKKKKLKNCHGSQSQF
jgi:hypothetical protein